MRPFAFDIPQFYTVFYRETLQIKQHWVSINFSNLDATSVTVLLHLSLFKSPDFRKTHLIILNSFMLVWKSVAGAERDTSLLGLKHKHRLWRLMPLRLTAWIEVCTLEERLIALNGGFALRNGKGVVLPNRFSSSEERRGTTPVKLNYTVKWSLAHQ